MVSIMFPNKCSFICSLLLVCVLTFPLIHAAREPVVAPYVDATRMSKNFLVDLHQQTGLKAVTLAFVLGTGFGCTPCWGGEQTLNDTNILNQVKDFQNLGGQVIVATGGAMGPYLETSCSSADQLANAYKKTLDIVHSTHLDIDIEASVNTDLIMNALKRLKSMMPAVTVSFTLMVQSDDYGLNDPLGTNVLKRAANLDVQVDIVNPMVMEFSSTRSSYGDAVVAAGESVVKQMKTIWTKKSDAQLYQMLGMTPMIGRNFNGKIFQIEHAKELVQWAKEKNIGHLSFWSLGRDNGDCPGGGVSPDCSSIAQSKFEFSKIFQQYSGHQIDDNDDDDDKKPSPETPKPTQSPPSSSTSTTRKPNKKIDCSNGETYIPHETDCDKYYWCFEGKPHLEHCAINTVWDPKINSCNYARDAHRTDCV